MQTDPEAGGAQPRENGHVAVDHNAPLTNQNPEVDGQQTSNNLAKSPTYLEAYLNSFSSSDEPLWIRQPGRKYQPTRVYRHKDSLGRLWIGPEEDRYLSATDGRLSELVVQASEDIWNGPSNSTWARKKVQKCTPAMLRVVYSLLGDHLQNRPGASWGDVCLGWLPACLIIAVLLFIPSDLGGEKRNNGRYEQFKYHYWGYSKVSSNAYEIQPSRASELSANGQEVNAMSERPLRPSRLCLLRREQGIEIINVCEWEAVHGTIDYLFICYTAEQFSGSTDLDELHRIAEAAARTAGVMAYWIACSCMRDDHEQSEDVYRISDVVRGAHSLVVIIGPPVATRDSHPDAGEMLRNLGSRMWTFPEVLLSPSNRPISLYMRGCDTNSFRTLSKRNFAIEAWGDAPVSRQLIDHYEGSIILSPLELVSIGLQCFPNRDTTMFYQGDRSYALMGLLRRRPRVDESDSEFQAFCRLSLANDSNQLIERLICMLPRDMDLPWYRVEDYWNSNLWDVQPICQVVGIGEDDSVILSGAFGAPIRWKSFEPVNLLMRNTLKRWVARVVLRSSPAWLIIGALLLAASRSRGGDFAFVTAAGWVFAGLYVLVVLASPYLICSLYVGKPWAAQPWLFGFEGYLGIDEIETLIFGLNLGRLKWSPYSSDLSLHVDQKGECVGQDPTRRESTAQFVSASRQTTHKQLKVFTLVDTNTLTVTLFRAVRPPVAMLLCGSEGGMQRALLCSYDWKSQTLYRESVLRVETLVLEKMSRVDRFRLGLKKRVPDTVEAF
ncbi:hypothetical protein CNMCM6936_008043 [Aspergillus lentulus]|uniref:3-hydroxyisobutyrate dehydrogenase protein n=1 Tax=Aspergillus lentulus TaxID=293939 RepID=A0AAN5YKL9_ASPLE|nr:hypothetical protein CNMCM6069_002104 [Aspergillus lentulus]KAF4165255.1 hypothetical protein CNMCM6936_008043 [Aspergillus lentulus]KAF4202734.1 hypothetical protein CNMCM8927_009637 [Aspergillus lentulus]